MVYPKWGGIAETSSLKGLSMLSPRLYTRKKTLTLGGINFFSFILRQLAAGLFMVTGLTSCHAVTEDEMKRNREAAVLYWQANKNWRSGHIDAMIHGYEEAARKGHKGAHSELARQYCGRSCIFSFEQPKNDADREYIRRYGSSIVPVDYIKAYMHFLLAKDGKNNQRDRLKKLAVRMTKEEITQAQQLANEWKQNYYDGE